MNHFVRHNACWPQLFHFFPTALEGASFISCEQVHIEHQCLKQSRSCCFPTSHNSTDSQQTWGDWPLLFCCALPSDLRPQQHNLNPAFPVISISFSPTLSKKKAQLLTKESDRSHITHEVLCPIYLPLCK